MNSLELSLLLFAVLGVIVLLLWRVLPYALAAYLGYLLGRWIH